MPKLRAAFAALAVFLLLHAAPGFAQSVKPTLTPPPELAKRGTLIFCANLSNPPSEGTAADGQTPVGIDIDVMHALGAMLGLKIRIVNLQFSTILGALEAGKCDATMAGFGDTPDRDIRYNMIDYWRVASGILVKSGNPEHITTIEDLSGKRVTVQLGGRNAALLKVISDKLVAAGKKPIDIRPLPNNVVAFQNLDIGRVDAMCADAVVMSYFASHSKGKFEVGGTPIPPSDWAIVILKPNTALADAMRKGIATMVADGQMLAILTKWGVQNGIGMCGGPGGCQTRSAAGL